MNVKKFTNGPFAENTYLLLDDEQALLIDPGFYENAEFQALKNELDASKTELTAILLTHAHVDHVMGLQKVLDHFDVPVYLNDSDRYLWDNYASQARMFGFEANDFGFIPEPLKSGELWRQGPFVLEVLFTPGHAPDHVSLYAREEGIVIAGDVLFKEGIGRTDLYKGNFKLLEQSIREKLYTLPDKTIVYPGHGPKTTIGYEKEHNPFVGE